MEADPNQARVKLVGTHPGGALYVAVFGSELIEIRDCDREDPTAVRSSVTIVPQHAAALSEALMEAVAQAG